MKKVLTVALSSLTLLAGAAFAEPPPVGSTGNAPIAVHDSLSQHRVPDLQSLLGGARSHSCRVNAVAGAILTAAGSAIGNPTVIHAGMVLTIHSLTICV